MSSPTIIAIGGFTSEVGKTTLLCHLLRAFPGWEAIKTTRGHYRSCGKDAGSCCVSHLLSADPVVRSGREHTYEVGKDTGRYWDAGATNVHWLIATDDQIERGIKQALARVTAAGVFVEGNTFSKFVQPNYFVMVKRSDCKKIKKSARQLLRKASAIYASDAGRDSLNAGDGQLSEFLETEKSRVVPVYTSSDLPALVAQLRKIVNAAVRVPREIHNRART